MAAFTPAYALMNSLAAVVASYGLLQDSTAVVIGAMIIAMLLGPISGMALALVEGDNTLLRKSLLAEVGGSVLVLTIAFLIGRIHADLPLGKEITARTTPNILDLAIALAAGAAGAYATISPRISAGLVGVAIATALVPPLCTCAICVARGLYRAGGGAFLLFLTNIVAIQSVTSLTLWLAGYGARLRQQSRSYLRRFAPSALLLGALALFLTYSFERALAREAFLTRSKRLLRQEIEQNGAASLVELQIQPSQAGTTLIALVRAPWVIVPESCGRLQAKLRQALGRDDLTLRIRTVITRECNATQFLWDDTSELEETLGR